MAIKGLHHIHLAVQDLPGGVTFAQDFGLHIADVLGARTYLRGLGRHPYLVVLEQAAQSDFRGLSFEADSRADLDRAIARHGAGAIRELDGPGGGIAVDLRDPNGFAISLVHGVADRTPDPLPPSLLLNQGYEKPRIGNAQEKSPLGPPPVIRLGHVGIYVQDWKASDAWYRDVLGLIPSDLIHVGDEKVKVGGFYRVNRGDEFVDHHVVGMFGLPGKQGLHHLSLEVPNSEAQFMAHRWLAQRQRNEVWGVGRHPLGSHVFDVWKDPNGFRYETFSDTDLLNASAPAGLHAIQQMEMDLWSDRDVQIYFA